MTLMYYECFFRSTQMNCNAELSRGIFCRLNLNSNTGKGKAVPLQAWSSPEGSRKLRFPDFMITAHDGGKVVILTPRLPLPPANTPGTHFY
jgi:hypothetical protein